MRYETLFVTNQILATYTIKSARHKHLIVNEFINSSELIVLRTIERLNKYIEMQNKEKKKGIIAGISLVIMAIVAGLSFGYAHNTLVADSPELTLQNLIDNKSLFLAELSGWSFIFILDAIVAIALYFYFRNTSKQISLITSAIRIVYTLILGVAIVQLFQIVPVLSMNNSISNELVVSDTYLHIQLFEKLWSIGLIVFGLHLVGLGYLSVKSKAIHWSIAYLLYLGGISYTFIHTAQQLSLFNAEVISSIEKILVLPMTLAEMLLAFWLIYNGFRKSSGSNT